MARASGAEALEETAEEAHCALAEMDAGHDASDVTALAQLGAGCVAKPARKCSKVGQFPLV
jgi:hypothetical protein